MLSPSHPSSGSFSGGPHNTPLRQYFTRKWQSTIRTNDLPVEPGYIGPYSAWGLAYCLIFLSIPVAYVYIGLVLLREVCIAAPAWFYQGIQYYLPTLGSIVGTMESSSSRVVELWCFLEGLFYLALKLQIQWLQYKDPLEASLSAAPMMDSLERGILWNRMMEAEDNLVSFVEGWFFDTSVEEISENDVTDFLCWSMFEGRHYEHLTNQEASQVQGFLHDMEKEISIHLYGVAAETGDKDVDRILSEEEDERPTKQVFRFHESTQDDEHNFFSTLFENYKQRYEQAKHMLEHSSHDLYKMMADAETISKQTASNMYNTASNSATNIYENAYDAVIGTGSNMDKHLTALGHATQQQLSKTANATRQQCMDAWNSVSKAGIRLESAEFLSAQTKRIQQQLKGYRVLLSKMRHYPSVPSHQMAKLMNKITECNEAMEGIESRAMDAFCHVTGLCRSLLSVPPRRHQQRYAKYSYDPLLGLATYPLGFHLFVLGATEIPLRIMMRNRGFEYLRTGPVNYYYHPGSCDNDDDVTPIVFVHGIGIGLVMYIQMIDALLRTGRPILLPEIPYVSGFRPLQSPNSVLQPSVVCSVVTEMLAKHGYLSGTFCGHSYGTVWLAYMTKYAPQAVAAVCFLDPICFCLHVPRLTKQFVYHKPDPGTISYMVRTDVIVNWTIQRSFPWAWIVLFVEQIQVPCSVFLSDCDMLVPAQKVELYLKKKGAPIADFKDDSLVMKQHFRKGDLNATIFRGDGHGDWTERSGTSDFIVDCLQALCEKAEGKQS